MNVQVTLEEPRSFASYVSVPISFRVERIVDVAILVASRGSRVESHVVAQPYVKDYDAYPGNSPLSWTSRFDLGAWGVFGAYVGCKRVGGAAVVTDDTGVTMIDGRDDLAVLFDLRVDPSMRRRGVGRALLQAVIEWSVVRGTRRLLVETQDVNFAACRFYSTNGFVLDAANRGAYSDVPQETQLLWHRDLE